MKSLFRVITSVLACSALTGCACFDYAARAHVAPGVAPQVRAFVQRAPTVRKPRSGVVRVAMPGVYRPAPAKPATPKFAPAVPRYAPAVPEPAPAVNANLQQPQTLASTDCNDQEVLWDRQGLATGPRSCTKSGGTKIIGGRNAKIARWPGHVALRLRNAKDLSLYVCGGTMLDRRWVLTAAHCVHNSALGKIGPPYREDLGNFATTTEQKSKGFNGDGTLEVVSGTDDLKRLKGTTGAATIRGSLASPG